MVKEKIWNCSCHVKIQPIWNIHDAYAYPTRTVFKRGHHVHSDHQIVLVRKTILIRNLCLLWDSVHDFSPFPK